MPPDRTSIDIAHSVFSIPQTPSVIPKLEPMRQAKEINEGTDGYFKYIIIFEMQGLCAHQIFPHVIWKACVLPRRLCFKNQRSRKVFLNISQVISQKGN